MMKLDRKEFLASLQAVLPGVSTANIAEQSDCILFHDGRAITYNDEICMQTDVGVDVVGAIPAKPLIAILNRSSAKEVTIRQTEKELGLTMGKARAGIRVDRELALPMDEVPSPGDWEDLPEDFVDSLKFCLPSTGQDMSQPVLTNIKVGADNIVSSDNFRISCWKTGPGFDLGLLPATAAVQLVKYTPRRASVTGTWAHFDVGNGTTFSARLFVGEFPDVSRLLEDPGGNQVRFRKDAREVLNRAGVFAQGEFSHDSLVEIDLESSGKATFRAQSDIGWIKERVRVRYAGDSFSFYINPQLLDSVLEKSHDIHVTGSLLRFETDASIHIVAITPVE